MSASWRLIDAGDHWELAIQGESVDQCCFDFAVALRFSAGAEAWELRIERPFVMLLPDGSEQLVVPEEGAHLASILSVLRRKADWAHAFKDGRLELRFSDGIAIQVPPDEGFEAWTVSGPGGVRLVSLPGGELAVWGPSRGEGG